MEEVVVIEPFSVRYMLKFEFLEYNKASLFIWPTFNEKNEKEPKILYSRIDYELIGGNINNLTLFIGQSITY